MQAAKNKCQKRDTNYEDKCYTKKQKRPPPTYQNPWPAAKNNFFMQLRDLPMEKVEMDNGGISTKTCGTNESKDKGRPPAIVFTSEANFISLQREL